MQLISWPIMLMACGANNPSGSSLPPAPTCNPVMIPVEVDDSSIGFSASDVFDVVEGEHQATGWYYGSEESTRVTFTAARGDHPVAMEVWQAPEEDPSLPCPADQMLVVTVDASLVTDDGAFDEHWTHELDFELFSDAVGFPHPLDPASLGGTFARVGIDEVSVSNNISADDTMFGMLQAVEYENEEGVAFEQCILAWNLDASACF